MNNTNRRRSSWINSKKMGTDLRRLLVRAVAVSGDVFALFDGILAVLVARVVRLTHPLLLVSAAAFRVPSSRLINHHSFIINPLSAQCIHY